MSNSTVCIQDKNRKYWQTLCSSDFVEPEIRNMQRHLENAVKYPSKYDFLDLDSSVILVDDKIYSPQTFENLSDDELLNQLLG